MPDAYKIRELVKKCLFETNELVDGKPPEDAILVQGPVHSFGFHKGRIEESKEEIKAQLLELPDVFHVTKGGGYSFLEACMDRAGNQWVGHHSIMEELFLLGEAAGFVKPCMPREFWPIMPGGMPYYVVDVGLE